MLICSLKYVSFKHFGFKKSDIYQKVFNLKICIDTEGAQIRTKVERNKFLKKGQKISIFKNKKFHLYPIDVYEKLKKMIISKLDLMV